MKKTLLLSCAAVMFAAGAVATAAGEANRLFDIDKERTIPLTKAVAELKQRRLLTVGEQHDSTDHHRQQLAVIRALHEAGAEVAVGMEMFRSDNQKALDEWTAGKMPEREFVRVYYDNWNFDWDLYAPILRYVRDNRISLVGLNVSREITSQVARQGFASLTDDQRGKLKDVACRVDRTYMEFIKRAYGAHAHGNLNFTYFCETQLVWDSIMAINALNFIREKPAHVMVIVAGNGHAWKGGIPAQIAARSDVPVAVVLPEIPGVVEPGRIDSGDADYLFLR